MKAAPLVRRVRSDEWSSLKDVRLRALFDSPESFGSTHEREVAFDDAVWTERAVSGEVSDSVATWVAPQTTGHHLVGTLDVTFVGTVTVIKTNGADAGLELVGMWVDPTKRGTGLASELVQTAVDHALQVGCTRLRLWVAEPNVRAQRLYLRHGFQMTGAADLLPSNPKIQELEMAMTFFTTEIPRS
jgi:RimJ/RimL family protein N-acetyltransferase